MSQIMKREYDVPDPVEVPTFGADGGSQGNRTFKAGGVRNYPNVALLKEAVRRYQGHLRRGTASTKMRGEVNGTNRKPWRQKGTGRARQGTKNAPHWRGGGVSFGPKPRVYDYGLPRKQRQLATRHALLTKLLDGETKVVSGLSLAKPSTRSMSRLLGKLGVLESCLLGVATDTDKEAIRNLVQSCRNLRRVEVLTVGDFNALALLKHRHLVLTAEALDEIQKREDTLPHEAAQRAGGDA
ncbi:MAG: 50S ribosomal protein L4 [Planctomycetes bacterium]|nr:50S ribosomal protein L4 [Planctomycetota bacterium]